MRPILALSQLVFALSLPLAMAAQGPPLKLGDRIRVTVPSLGVKPFVGIVERVPADTILVRTSPEGLSAFPLDQVARLELSRGTGSPTWALFAPLWMPLAGGALALPSVPRSPGAEKNPRRRASSLASWERWSGSSRASSQCSSLT